MARFGEMLREARESRGLSLSDVEEATKIRQKYLEGMERGDYASLPPRIYMRGFLKNLADFLEIDSPTLISAWANDAPPEQPQARIELTVASLDRPWIDWTGVLSLLIVVILLVLGALVLVNLRPWERLNIPLPAVSLPRLPFGPAATQPPLPNSSPVAVAQTLTAVLPTLTVLASPVGVNAPSPTSAPPVSSPTAVAPVTSGNTPVATPAPLPTLVPIPTVTPPLGVSEIRLQLVLTGVSWVQVITDSQPALAFQGTIQSGNTRFFTAQQRIQLRVGNAGGVKVFLNGRDEPSLGGVGDVVDREWLLKPEGIVTPTPLTRPTATP